MSRVARVDARLHAFLVVAGPSALSAADTNTCQRQPSRAAASPLHHPPLLPFSRASGGSQGKPIDFTVDSDLEELEQADANQVPARRRGRGHAGSGATDGTPAERYAVRWLG